MIPVKTEEERAVVSGLASDLAKTFATAANQQEEPNLYTKRFARYKKYVEDDMVRVEDTDSNLYQKWIPRKQATMTGVCYHDPIEWIKKREDELGKC